MLCRLVRLHLQRTLTVDVEEYFAAAKDVMKDLEDKAVESRSSLAKKMQVYRRIWRLIIGM